jgi:Protein of unknown function (DUF1185).
MLPISLSSSSWAPMPLRSSCSVAWRNWPVSEKDLRTCAVTERARSWEPMATASTALRSCIRASGPRFARRSVGGADIIPGTKKVAGPGAQITMPIGNKDNRWVFDDMDAVDLTVPDAPHADEIVIALALSCGGRPGARTKKPQ